MRMDSKGRITLPKEIREKAGIKSGSKLTVYVKGKGEVLVKSAEKDPSEQLAEILGEFTLTLRDRVKAEDYYSRV